MRIGIMSDTHDDLDNLNRALERLRSEGVTKIFHCGDVCGPDAVRALAGFNVRIVQGNMDRHPELAHAIEKTLGRGQLAWIQRGALNGRLAVVIHGDNEEMLGNLITSGRYAYVFHGHTHRRRDQQIGHTRVINPGALGGTRYENRSFCILDPTTGEARFVEI